MISRKFVLNTEKEYDKAEKFKFDLENKGYNVEIKSSLFTDEIEIIGKVAKVDQASKSV